MARYAVIYDACVLYPAPLRDLLVQLATANLFHAKWTEQIHAEWIENLLLERPDLQRANLERTRDLMNSAVLDCLVTGYEHLIPTIELPDANDRHVVAAAIHGRADAIITTNLKDFPAGALEQHKLEPIHPDDFIVNQLDLDLPRVLVAARDCRLRLKHPEKTAEEYLDILRAQALPKTVAMLRAYSTIL